MTYSLRLISTVYLIIVHYQHFSFSDILDSNNRIALENLVAPSSEYRFN